MPVQKDWKDQSFSGSTCSQIVRWTMCDCAVFSPLLKGAKGEIFSEFYASLGEFEKCPKLDALIKASGEESAEIKTPTIKIDAEHDIENLVLQFPFPKCKKKE